MSAMVLMSLLTISMFLPIFEGYDEADEEPEDEIDPTPTADQGDLLEGTDGPDDLAANDNDTLSGGEGNDTLIAGQATDGVTLNGQGGADELTILGTNSVASGGGGQDTIGLEGPVVSDDTPNTSAANGGDGDDTISASGIGGVVTGGGGEDVINIFGDLDSVSGGNGNDIITYDSRDYGGGTPLDGGLGNDRISVSDTPGTNTQSIVDGGAGDDTLSSELANFTTATLDNIDVLTGGSGADVFEMSFVNQGSESAGGSMGTVVEITDFNAAEDQLIVDLSGFPVFATQIDAPNGIDFNVVERADGSGSDVNFTVTNADAEGPLTGTIALTGTTGLQQSDVSLLFTGTQNNAA